MTRIDGYPPLRPHGRASVPALTGEEAAAWDRRAIDRIGVPERVLMENAGRAAALVLQRLFPEGPVVGVIGAGNNGGDALVTLRTLASWGRDVRAVVAADRVVPDPLLHGWAVPTVDDAELSDEGVRSLLERAAVVVDGILGTGVRGAPRARQAAAINAVNASGRPVLSIDVPSGIDPSTGAVEGEGVRAAVTVAFGAPKLGSLLQPARDRVGRLVAVEIGFPPIDASDVGAWVSTPAWACSHVPARPSDTHKNAVGRVLVVAGGAGMAGAALLAARGALRAGAGLVRVCTAPANRGIVQAALPEAIWVDASDAGAVRAALSVSDAVVVGPGLGTDEAARSVATEVLRMDARPVPTLLDADALNLAAAEAFDLSAVGASRPLLVTPHPGEMGRLLGDSGPTSVDAPARARSAAERFRCAVLLKGAPSVVADHEGPLRVDTQASSDLAAAGMGDALAGVCGTLLAQGLPPATAGAVGLYLTGRAARLAAKGVSMTPSDVIERIPDALAEGGAGADAPIGAGDALDFPFVLFDADPAR